jgi:hypothetical protein
VAIPDAFQTEIEAQETCDELSKKIYAMEFALDVQ